MRAKLNRAAYGFLGAGAVCLAWVAMASAQAVDPAGDGSAMADVRLDPIRRTAARAQDRAPFVLSGGGLPATIEVPAGDSDVSEAILLIQEKAYAEALPLLEGALQRMPTVEPVWEALGWCYCGTGRTNDAQRLWEQYMALRPESPKAHSLLAQLAILRSDWRTADTYLAGALKFDPRNYDFRYWYAQNLFRLGRLDPALTLMEELVRADAARYDVKTDLARICTLVQRYEDALDLWTEIVDQLPANLDFRTEYARALLLVGSLEDADEQARRILAEEPTRAQAMTIRADIAELRYHSEAAIEALRELIEQADDKDVRAQLQVRLAARYVELNREDPGAWPLDLALEQFDAAIDTRPDYVPWLNQYAQLAIMGRRPGKARPVVDRILRELNPYNHAALRSRFELAMQARDLDAAEAALDAAYDSYQPENPYRHLDRARIEVLRGRYDMALEELDRLEAAGRRGAVFTLLYHGLTESEWMALTSTRRLQEHLVALRQAGYTFLAPTDVPTYLRSRDGDEAGAAGTPWLARQVDHVRYAFTGARRLGPAKDDPIEKVAVVTFDDGLRTSFQLGTPVAEELGIPFGMFVITSIEELNAPMYAAWEEIKGYHDSGAWEIGSHLMNANTDRPAGPEPAPSVYTLPNRVWLPERRRLETLREWSTRVRNDFEESRRRIEARVGLRSDEPMAVAYPYSEIGQEEGSNVAPLINPIRAILNEAARQYQVGFVVDRFGYTCPGDNLYMVRRYEPGWDEDAESVVEHALVHHPVMVARRMRAEIAALTDRPYLAERQLELLRRDGYPERRWRELAAFVHNRAGLTQAAASLAEDDAREKEAILKPSGLYVAATYRDNRSNEQIVQDHGELKAGLNLNPRLGIEAYYRLGRIDQTVTSNIWFNTRRTETTSSTETRTETINGTSSTTVVEIETSTTRDVQTNRVERKEYDAEFEEVRGSLTLRLDDTASLLFSLGQKTVDFAPGYDQVGGEESEIIGSASVAWRPYRALQLLAGYDHDVVPSARRLIAYDGVVLNALWKVSDGWDVACNTRYAKYKDQNAFLGVSGNSFWQLFERQGIWGGLDFAVYSMDEDSGFYWSPYWDSRYAGVLRLRRAYPLYFFQFDVRIGQQQEKARPEEENEYRNLQAQAESDGTWDPGPEPGAPWDTFVGLGGTYRQRLWNHLDLVGNMTVNFLRDYSEHDLSVGVQYNF